MIIVKIGNSFIEKKNYLGFDKKFNYKDFDGYEISIVSSRSGTYEYLYLVKNRKKIIKLSEFYHKNYSELKSQISTHLKDLGEIPFSYIDEFKEIFQ